MSAAPTRNAVSYARFSSRRQGKEGKSSEARQVQEFQSFCERHQLRPAKEGYIDRGLSGYTGKHRKKGELRRLLAAAEQGAFPEGTVIVVESWDRLGRLRPDRQTELVSRLLKTGVAIGICRLGEIFTGEDFGTHRWTTFSVFAQLAYQESKQKSDRVRAARRHNNQRARDRKLAILTRNLPAWVAAEGDSLVTIPERVASVRRVFELAAQGLGYGQIASRLHTEGHVPFKGPSWCRSYVRFILTDRRALGEHQPTTTRVKVDRRDKPVLDKDGDEVHETVNDGEPIAGYYPAVVSQEEFAGAQAGKEGRTLRKGKSNVWTPADDAIVQAEAAAVAYKILRARGCKRTHTAVYQRKRRLTRLSSPAPVKKHTAMTINVFARLIRNARGTDGYTVVNRLDSGAPVPVLVNGSSRDGKGTKCMSFPYLTFEAAILSKLDEIDPAELTGPKTAGDEDEVTPLRDQRDRQRTKVKTLEAIQDEEPSLANARVLRQAEERAAELEKELRAAQQRAAHPVEVEWQQFRNLYEALQAAEDPIAARLKLRAVLRSAVDTITLLVVPRGRDRLAAVQVDFREGTRRAYLILHRPPQGNRHGKATAPGGWWGRSLATVTPQAGDLDLRDRDHARRLEAVLARLDPADVVES